MAKTATEEYPKTYPAFTSPSGRYYVQCIRSWMGDSVVWWSPNRSGYTFGDLVRGLRKDLLVEILGYDLILKLKKETSWK